MPQQPSTETDRLANVINVISLGRKTGTLTVERRIGSEADKGIIIFVNGQMIEASARQLTGVAAFQWLSTWGPCLFTFTPGEVSTLQGSSTPIPHRSRPASDTNPRLRTQPLPIPDALRHDRPATGPQPVPVSVQTAPYHLRSLDDALQRIASTGLSRAHRRLFLLIDGFRPTTELIRLMGRSQAEVESLLQDLERAGVIRR